MSFQTRNEARALLKEILSSLESTKNGFKRYKSVYVIKDDKKQLDAAISKWFDETPIIVRMGLKEELLEPCDEEFKKLLKMIQCVLHKKRCIKAITATTSELRKLEHVVATTRFNHMHELDQILSKIDKEKIQDLSDAVKCAHFGIYKASAVLGWGAAMFCIRHEIEKEGFEKLNRICKEMSQADNRYRQLKKIGTVSNHASLQEIPDSSILLIAECYGMIDNGQRKRLLSDMNTRHTSAHTGDAATTRLNLLSLYSNLNKFIFSKFQK